MSEPTQEEIARIIDPHNWAYVDLGTFPREHQAVQGLIRESMKKAAVIKTLMGLVYQQGYNDGQHQGRMRA